MKSFYVIEDSELNDIAGGLFGRPTLARGVTKAIGVGRTRIITQNGPLVPINTGQRPATNGGFSAGLPREIG